MFKIMGVLFLGLGPLCAPVNHAADIAASTIIVPNYSVSDRSILDALHQLATQAHIVIGISGTLTGSGGTAVSVRLSNIAVSNVLNVILSNDKRFTWVDAPDGAIQVTLGDRPLDILDVVVHDWSLVNVPRYEMTQKIAAFPEISTWLNKHSCNLSEIHSFAGPSRAAPIWETFRASSPDQSLRRALDDLARQTETYYWSAIKLSENQCDINLVP